MPFHFLRVATGALGTLLSTAALAATTTFTGSLTPGGPTMPVVSISTPNCTSQGSTQVLYKTYPFTVSSSGSYTFTVSSPEASIYIHAGAFNPASPLANCIAASNTQPINLSVNLNTGTNYFLTIFDDTFVQDGTSYVAAISGPGNITVNGPCSDFTDVLVSSAFCGNVQWLRNRGVTLGCTATAYCPNDPVTRLQMAAFMNRLGNALEPLFIHVTQSGASATVDADGVVCQTTAEAINNFPRVASVSSVMFYHRAAASERVDTRLVFSLDNGATWSSWGTFVAPNTNVAGQYATHSPAANRLILNVGESVRFGIRATLVSAGPTNDAGCELTVRLDSHTGSASPFDVPDAGSAPPTGPTPSGG